MRSALLLPILLLAAGCSPEPPRPVADSTPWVGTITTEGDVTTVINESGSVWGGTARLVEEASIGVDAGEDAYMFGDVSGVAAHDGRIFILDSQVPTVRVYDLQGAHLFDIGREGDGPGEFGRGLRQPAGLSVDENGRLYVHARSKIEVFSADGELLDTWTLDRLRGSIATFQIAATGLGSVVLAGNLRCGERQTWRCGVGLTAIHEGAVPDQAVPIPDLGYETPRIELEFRRGASVFWSGGIPPFVPTLVWNVDATGRMLVGRADRYQIEPAWRPTVRRSSLSAPGSPYRCRRKSTTGICAASGYGPGQRASRQ